MAKPNDRILEIQDRVRTRSQDSRRRYLDDIAAMTDSPDSDRRQVSCSNMAHAAAGAGGTRMMFWARCRAETQCRHHHRL